MKKFTLILSLFLVSCAEYKTVSTKTDGFNEIEIITDAAKDLTAKKIKPTNFPYEYELDYRADRVYFYSCNLKCQDSITFKIR